MITTYVVKVFNEEDAEIHSAEFKAYTDRDAEFYAGSVNNTVNGTYYTVNVKRDTSMHIDVTIIEPSTEHDFRAYAVIWNATRTMQGCIKFWGMSASEAVGNALAYYVHDPVTVLSINYTNKVEKPDIS